MAKNLGGWGAAWPMFGATSLAAVVAAATLAMTLRNSADQGTRR
jgi:hypothetical protein